MEKRHIFSIDVSVAASYHDYNKAITTIARENRSEYICIANVHMLVEAKRCDFFASVVNNAVIITPDGKPLTWALRVFHGLRQARVAGMDLLPDILNSASAHAIPVFFYGGSPLLLAETERYLKLNYQSLLVAGMFSPPFRDLTMAEEDEVAAKINSSGAKIVFVVLGCPKQEKWMARMKGKINAVMIGVGGALPVLVGIQRRAPMWMQKSGLEWLYRLRQEPIRLFKRYAVTNAVFCWLFCKAWAAKGISRRRTFQRFGGKVISN